MGEFSVVVVEDEPATRNKLKQAIEQHERLELCGAADSLHAGRELIRKAPDLLLVDLGLPDGNGIDLIHETKCSNAATEIMVLSSFGDEKHVLQAIEAGASGYLLKTDPLDEIADQALGMLHGESPISPGIARHILQRHRQSSEAAQSTDIQLTQREEDVLKSIAKGYNRAEIGEMLGMSPHTVTTHIKHIYRKLDVHSRTEAVFEAYQSGLIRLND